MYINDTKGSVQVDPFDRLPISKKLAAELRSDHAGEEGAVQIYRGILAVSRSTAVRHFARHHVEAEQAHLGFFEAWLPAKQKSKLLPLWRLSGWLLGATAALMGPRMVYQTVAAVETFVEQHYHAQIEYMASNEALEGLSQQLQTFCDDEVNHRIDAQAHLGNEPGLMTRAWHALIGNGSALGVAVARRI
jgi:ubiquinone biosynthesis monooxygenase Coq7